MGTRVSNTQDNNTSTIDFSHNEDHDLLFQQVKQLADIQESLEPLNLPHCTEDSLNCLVLQLQEIVNAIQPMSSHIIENHVVPKKDLLQDLRSALVELIHAQKQLATEGRTPSFYNHLLTCQEYLDHTFDVDGECACSPSKIEAVPQPNLLQKTSPAHIQKRYTDFLTAQGVLEHANLSSMIEEESSVERFDCVNDALNGLYVVIREISEFSHRSSYIQEETFSITYRFSINIAYMEEQIPRLLELIKTFHSAYYSSPKRAQKISREIAYNLEAIVRSSREVTPALNVLLKLPCLQRENEHHLQLIYSSENR